LFIHVDAAGTGSGSARAEYWFGEIKCFVFLEVVAIEVGVVGDGGIDYLLLFSD